MTLTTHAIVGATLAAAAPNYPILGFVVGFGSHYVLDAIPHWDYPISGIEEKKNNRSIKYYLDFLKIGLDGTMGLIFSFIILGVFFHSSPLAIFMGAIGGMTPDALQFVYWKWPHQPLISLQKLHQVAHAKLSLNDKPFIGILSGIIFLFLVVFIFKVII